jgi:peptidoglycan/LPS O-acetylase OafA/YrhL
MEVTPMRPRRILGLVGVAVLVAALASLVLETAASGEDWVELAVIGAAALVVSLALVERRRPRAGRRRTIVRTPESRW